MQTSSPFLDLAYKEAETFQNNNVAWMECLITCDCTKSIMELGYNILVRKGKIIPIEKMTQAEKENIWNSAREFSKGRLDKEGLIKVAKGLVTLEYLLT
jgi:hypothetical protein